MQLCFLGATDTVTGSRTLVQQGQTQVLVDCGLFQGDKALRLRNREPFPVPPSALDGVVLTHAHIDHSGLLPLLARQGLRAPVHCTPATADLCGLLLPDSGHLMEEEAAEHQRLGSSRHHPPLPLYTRADAERCLRLLRTVPFDQPWEAAPGWQALFRPAGHLPGAAMLRLEAGPVSVLFSGDLGRPDDLVMKPPAPPPAADYLVLESTYGDREHARTDPLQALAAVVCRTAARGGVLLVPAFAVGRAQALILALHRLARRGDIPRLPVVLDSPMAARATEVCVRHPSHLRPDTSEWLQAAGDVQAVQSAEESEQVRHGRGPRIVIAASGMLTGGRVLHHLRSFAPDERNTILLVGHQAAGTRGADLVQGVDSVKVFGAQVPVRAEVARLAQWSGHADAGQILDWLRGFARAPRRVFINHGEPAAAQALGARIERTLGWACHRPAHGETVALDAC
ncbi:MBL fold metallo-hydrolase RNA specificity domain-containing protein [Ramlibacter rhizophilus]|uniref:MBL fold metallo-hydrolase n=1 Tax=Ramlibacter rhizophilus TaxID=1781167 RepID=A0A4Z0C0W6_9BURK|nr:MBL fold metallo-hydrolase [Ramlibacter rhizophilus]TFZ04851.1 MBL fold metallo-hydrolase [Ramlibacter rhizophilus]